jgi:hypothetical protein
VGFLPVMPAISFARPAGVMPPRRSTHVKARRKSGSLGSLAAPGRSTGMTGWWRSTYCRRQARISRSSQGPSPSRPTQTIAAGRVSITPSSASCQSRPASSSSSSSQGRRPFSRSSFQISRTAGLSRRLWLRKTSNCGAIAAQGSLLWNAGQSISQGSRGFERCLGGSGSVKVAGKGASGARECNPLAEGLPRRGLGW